MSMIHKENWKLKNKRVFEHERYSIIAVPVMSRQGPKRLYKAMISGESDLGLHKTGEEARKACQSHYTHNRKKALIS